MISVVLYMKPDCHLCEDALALLHRLQPRYPHRVQTVDIENSAELVRTYGERIPVAMIGEAEVAAPLTTAKLEKAFKEARRR